MHGIIDLTIPGGAWSSDIGSGASGWSEGESKDLGFMKRILGADRSNGGKLFVGQGRTCDTGCNGI